MVAGSEQIWVGTECVWDVRGDGEVRTGSEARLAYITFSALVSA